MSTDRDIDLKDKEIDALRRVVLKMKLEGLDPEALRMNARVVFADDPEALSAYRRALDPDYPFEVAP